MHDPEGSTRIFTLGSTGSPVTLRGGGTLGSIDVAYETYGTLDDRRDNAVLLFHALTGSQHASGVTTSVPEAGGRWTDEMHLGWWDDFIGPGKALDTDELFVICANYLGGCYGSTGPASIDPATGEPYGSAFPAVTFADMVDVQVELVRHLGIDRLRAVVGGSVGGFMALSLATRYPDMVEFVIPIASGLRVTELQTLHNFEQITAIAGDPRFDGGDYYDGMPPTDGLALARMIGHKTFVSLDALAERARSEVADDDGPGSYRMTSNLESYMWHQGTKFVERFDANSYLTIMKAWQTFDLLDDAGAASFDELFSRSGEHRYMVFSIDSDVCFYPEEQRLLVDVVKQAGVPVRRITVHSDKGHDSFLLEPELFAPQLRDTLLNPWT
jgi:homoserine O-acetyltransferase